MIKFLYLFLIFSTGAFAQLTDYKWPVPKDKNNTPMISGMGLPTLIEPTVTVTSYDVAARTALSLSGDDTGRQYRHLSIYNPSTTIAVYVCVGNATGCLTDMWKCPASMGVVDDFAYFGAINSITHVYYRLSGAGSVVPLIRWW